MTLAITADASAFAAGLVTLSVTGATGALPVGAAVYTANFSVSYDSWTGGTDSTPAAPSCGYMFTGVVLPGYTGRVGGFSAYDWSSDQQFFQRTVTGLTIGHVYRASIAVRINGGPTSVLAYLGVVGIGSGVDDPVALTQAESYTQVSYEFTATATSHVLQLRRTTGTAAALAVNAASVQRYSTTEGANSLSLTRSDGNGQRFVRRLSTSAADAAGALTVQDFEAAYYDCIYRVIDAGGTAATVTVSPVLVDTTTAPVQLVAVGTSGVLGLSRVDEVGRELAYRETGTALAILGRSGPVITTRADNQWTRTAGTLVLHADSEAQAQEIVALYQSSRVVFLRSGEVLPDFYHVASAIRLVPAVMTVDGWTFGVEVDFTEIAWPEGFLAGDSWSYADVLAAHLAYFDLPTTYPTYADLAAG